MFSNREAVKIRKLFGAMDDGCERTRWWSRGEKCEKLGFSWLVDERCSMSLEWWILFFFFFFFLIFSTRRNISTIVKYFVIIRIYGNLFWSRKMNYFLFDHGSIMGSFRFVNLLCVVCSIVNILICINITKN